MGSKSIPTFRNMIINDNSISVVLVQSKLMEMETNGND